jgi:hypothetical protein
MLMGTVATELVMIRSMEVRVPSRMIAIISTLMRSNFLILGTNKGCSAHSGSLGNLRWAYRLRILANERLDYIGEDSNLKDGGGDNDAGGEVLGEAAERCYLGGVTAQ